MGGKGGSGNSSDVVYVVLERSTAMDLLNALYIGLGITPGGGTVGGKDAQGVKGADSGGGTKGGEVVGSKGGGHVGGGKMDDAASGGKGK
ncbi:MAG TPA: hypothetical protein VE262_20405 [Blastocatellia bacterium]|nr:hypothetical protein [Blastocatellia bacterium]